MKSRNNSGIDIVNGFFNKRKITPFVFQSQVWNDYLSGKSGLLNAPTGSGKTYALWGACIAEYINHNPDFKKPQKNNLQVIWITPLRALAKDIHIALEKFCYETKVPWKVAFRTGDTSFSEKQKQKTGMPECLITTPESLHQLFTQKGFSEYFKDLKAIIIDEWHELLGSKRGVQVELALSKLKAIAGDNLKIWGISATIGNMEEAMDVLLGTAGRKDKISFVKAEINKPIFIKTIIPETIEKFPWAGHMGLNLLERIIPIIHSSKTTLLFTNTRAQTEIWYQNILSKAPEFAGQIAMHHGSLDNNVRQWVEEALHKGILKLVVCTSSLDLGVDFRPVDTVIQVGSPKGVARFLQRAGRSGHQPGETSKIYFLPTHSLELVEGAALKEAALTGIMESRNPFNKSFDVLIQYLITLASGDGFYEKELFKEIKTSYSYNKVTRNEWEWALFFISQGGQTLDNYKEFAKVEREGDFFQVKNKKVIHKHRLSIGTIVSDPVLNVRYITGGNIGTVEEWFISRLKSGDVFWFAGRNLEFVRIKEMTALVRNAKKKSGNIPRWMGGRIPLSSQLAEMIRAKLEEAKRGIYNSEEVKALEGLFELQLRWSDIPERDTLLVEKLKSREGYHIFIYPFEGRLVHEVLASLLAYRISLLRPRTFSLAMNDYGLELLSDMEIPFEEAVEKGLFSSKNLLEDISKSINESEMAKRKFRDIAAISGLVFQGYPGKYVSNKHLQASSQILFDVFAEYEPNNLLLQQSFQEVITQQVEQARLNETLKRMSSQKLLIKTPERPTPFAFPIMVDRLRGNITSEKTEDRIHKMKAQLEKFDEKTAKIQ